MMYVRGAATDLRRFLTGTRERGYPPMRLRFVGMGDFVRVGEELANLLTTVGGLQPDDRVLDIGCGVGRVAIPLTRFLSATGSYDGFDVVGAAVRWCSRNITASHPRFRFEHTNLYNSFYNRRGVSAAEYRFPYADASFDFAFATSVFTHLDRATARHYLEEAHRVIRPGGRLLGTFFVRGGEAPGLDFRHRFDGYALLDANTPDAAIEFDESLLFGELLPPSQWEIVRFERGAWSGRHDAPTYQDTIVARRR